MNFKTETTTFKQTACSTTCANRCKTLTTIHSAVPSSVSSSFFGRKPLRLTFKSNRPQGTQRSRCLKVKTEASGDAGKNDRRRVVVTGMGVVSCFGNDVDTFYDSLLAGKSGVKEIETFDTSELTTKFGGVIENFDHEGFIVPKMARRLDAYIKYILVSAKKALESAGLGEGNREGLDLFRCGALLGSAFGGFDIFATSVEVLENSGPRKMNPFCIPFAITNMGSALLAMDVDFRGPNYAPSSACATGNHCIIQAMNHIRNGEADVMLAGSSDAALLPIGIAGFSAAKALSKRNDDPAAASRPWDKNRDGFVMGEGAGVIVLEELEHARARGAPILAEVLGGAFTCDAHHMTEPNPTGEGVTMCIGKALQNARVTSDEVDYVNAHATSTPAGDLAEYRAICNALAKEDGSSSFKMNATKSMTGHLLGAAAAVEAITVIKAMNTGWVHPNLNLEDPEDEVDVSKLVGPEKEQLDVRVGISNSFGFGGHNSCLVLGKFSD
ncbi:hypothetical protein CYMTET_52520 [Cymbomonas tetramitiformis]|uniref:3-oxoacyl-[acyl-carrier-protein] synthase I, chloroplastic n=1 Tax=Cymbomonas tetramitiformis TaxID=36881 RepID=A0AAE0BKA1_9CHLO|nr:hypothetical protein CYMTET_52520 [Cymbomonas tetramitiformis]